jgi:hypothetical protein
MRETKQREITERYRKTKKGVLTNIYDHQKRRYPVTYSLEELHSKFLNDKKFDRLYNEWIKAGMPKEKKPTLDRINYKRYYTLNNIQPMTWCDNRYKQRMEMKAIRAKKVYAWKVGHILSTMIFKSQRHAVKLLGLHQGLASAVLNGHRNHTGGYVLSYEDPELLEKVEK